MPSRISDGVFQKRYLWFQLFCQMTSDPSLRMSRVVKRISLESPLTGRLRKHREQWWIEKCKEIKQSAAIGNSPRLCQLIRSVSKLIKKSDSPRIPSQGRHLQLWTEHFRAKDSGHTVTDVLSPMLPSETMQVDAIPSSEMKINGVTCFFKRHKADGQHGLSPCFSSRLIQGELRCLQVKGRPKIFITFFQAVCQRPRLNPCF